MPTAKKRINLTVEDEVFESLNRLAKSEKKSVASVSHLLLQKALELQEDFYFSKVSEDRLAKKQKKISHSDMWED